MTPSTPSGRLDDLRIAVLDRMCHAAGDTMLRERPAADLVADLLSEAVEAYRLDTEGLLAALHEWVDFDGKPDAPCAYCNGVPHEPDCVVMKHRALLRLIEGEKP